MEQTIKNPTLQSEVSELLTMTSKRTSNYYTRLFLLCITGIKYCNTLVLQGFTTNTSIVKHCITMRYKAVKNLVNQSIQNNLRGK